MNASTIYLRRLCRPNQGTPTEIIGAAWQAVRDDCISPQELLTKLPDCKTAIQNAAMCIFQDLEENIGFIVGAGFSEPVEAQPGFIPRGFVQALCQ